MIKKNKCKYSMVNLKSIQKQQDNISPLPCYNDMLITTGYNDLQANWNEGHVDSFIGDVTN